MGKILIIRGGALGDFILTLPAIKLIKDSLPEAHLEVLGYPNVTPIAKFAGLADETRSMEHGQLAYFFAPGADLPEEMVDYFASFDVVISFLYDPDAYFETNVRKAGVETYFRGPYKIDESSDSSLPAATQLAAPLEQLALFLDSPFVELDIPQPAIQHDAEESAGTLIAIHPGSGSPRKNWSFEGWVAVAQKILAHDPDVSFLIVSGEAEEETIDQFRELADAASLPVRYLAYPTLPELAGELTRADLFLGHDTGVSHLAAACGIPCVLLFGPTNPDIWSPQNPLVSVISAPEKDLSKIKPDHVWEKVCEVLHSYSTE